ncbi:MAG: DUF58 domain-containing protein [Ginsengibacter sp.]
MEIIKKYFGDLFITSRFYGALLACVCLFFISFYVTGLSPVALIVFFAFLIFSITDYALLFFSGKFTSASRITAARLSNGDENKIDLIIKNQFSFPVNINVIDELPEQFQERKWKRNIHLNKKQEGKIQYELKPRQRGEYNFGNIHMFVTTQLGLICRRITSEAAKTISVYPSFMQFHKYELLSDAIIQHESGTSRMRKIGQSMEFEQIKEYVTGDDIRTLNWKASARRGNLMINNFSDERSQQVYCIIDKGRLMKMPFDGLTLLDYAINSCLVLSNICLKKRDRVGVITFSNVIGTMLAADRKPVQKESILQLLYNQTTGFLESDFELLYTKIRSNIRHRSLLILFTNFESLSGLNRQIDYLRSIASYHLLLVVFFENTELEKLTTSHAGTVEDVYIKTIGEKFAFEKRLIAKELKKYGILSLLTSPQKLTVNAINKYLELKSRHAI